jgi:hypothetical protein
VPIRQLHEQFVARQRARTPTQSKAKSAARDLKSKADIEDLETLADQMAQALIAEEQSLNSP